MGLVSVQNDFIAALLTDDAPSHTVLFLSHRILCYAILKHIIVIHQLNGFVCDPEPQRSLLQFAWFIKIRLMSGWHSFYHTVVQRDLFYVYSRSSFGWHAIRFEFTIWLLFHFVNFLNISPTQLMLGHPFNQTAILSAVQSERTMGTKNWSSSLQMSELGGTPWFE